MKNGTPPVVLTISCLSGARSDIVAQNGGQHLPGIVAAERIEPYELAPRFVGPAMRVFGPIVHQHEQFRVGGRVREQVEQRLALVVEPMQVLDHQNERAPLKLLEEQAHDGIERAGLAELRVHARQPLLVVGDFEQCVEIGEAALQVRIETRDEARDLLAARDCAVFRRDVEIGVQQLDDRHIGRALAVRHREGFEHGPVGLSLGLELEEEARLADAWIGDYGNDLA